MHNQNERGPRTYAVIGAAMDVHRELGHGFLEAVYQEAPAIEFGSRDIPFQREVELKIQYKGHMLNKSYRADFICFGEVIIEAKAQSALASNDQSQALNYLAATGLGTARLINFGQSSLEYKRLVV